jgi:MoaA/NifB/PqqE/SkfB family radical SAM enzyme
MIGKQSIAYRIKNLKQQIKKHSHQRMNLFDFLHVMKEYRPLGRYMLKRFGWESWYSFWYTKLFVADEGGEYALKNPIYIYIPQILKSPFKMEIEHTTICDKKCIFCEHTYWNEDGKKVTLGQLKSVIEPVKSLKWIIITGEGSSFLNKDFIKMLEYLRHKHINVNFVDEMDFLDEGIAKKIVEMGINSIFISLDAVKKDTYEAIKKGCSFEKAVRNIHTLLKIKEEMHSPFPVLHFRFIIATYNYKEMPMYIELINSFKNRGVRSRVEFVGLLTFPGIEKYYIPFEDIPEEIVLKTCETALKYNINLYFTHASLQLPSINRCAAWTEPYVLIGGEVISCCAIIMSNNRQFLRDNSFGNIYEKPLTEIWNSEKFKNFRKIITNKKGPIPKTCYKCRAYNTQVRADKYGILE